MNERERIDAIEARVNAATPGRWEWQEGLYPNRMDSLLAVDPDDDNEVEDVIYTTVAGIIIKDEDAALLAVRAEAVTGGSVGTGISEIMEDAK